MPYCALPLRYPEEKETDSMTRRYLRIALLGSLVSLSACAQQSEVKQMHQSISALSTEMTQLNKETVKITQQNGANTPARLNSQVGTLRMSLRNIAANAQGTAVTLRIQGESNEALPAFTGTVEWGQIQGTTEQYQEVNVQNQLFSAPASVLAPSDVDIPLQLNGVTPDQLGFVRIHDVQPANAQ